MVRASNRLSAVEVRGIAQKGMTFDACAAAYIDAHRQAGGT